MNVQREISEDQFYININSVVTAVRNEVETLHRLRTPAAFWWIYSLYLHFKYQVLLNYCETSGNFNM